MLQARGAQQSVNLRRTDLQKFFLKSLGERRTPPLLMFQPLGQRRLQQLAS